jgi:hypothetical protein
VSSDAERLKYKAAELATKLEAARAQLAARCDRRDDMLLQARAAWERQLEEVGFYYKKQNATVSLSAYVSSALK